MLAAAVTIVMLRVKGGIGRVLVTDNIFGNKMIGPVGFTIGGRQGPASLFATGNGEFCSRPVTNSGVLLIVDSRFPFIFDRTRDTLYFGAVAGEVFTSESSAAVKSFLAAKATS